SVSKFDGIDSGDASDRRIGADLFDHFRKGSDGVIETKIVISQNKNKISFCKLENFRNIGERIARLGDDDFAVVLMELRQQCLFSGIARIVADDHLNARSCPGTGLRNSGTGQKTGTIRSNQYRKLHWPLPAQDAAACAPR